jgi:hypothetical protein
MRPSTSARTRRRRGGLALVFSRTIADTCSPSPPLLVVGAALIPVPFLLSDLSFRFLDTASNDGLDFGDVWELEKRSVAHTSFYATALSSAILLALSAASLGLPARPTQIGFRTRPLNRYKVLRQEFWNILGCWLSVFAAIHLGGATVGCVVMLEVLKAVDSTFLSQGIAEWLLLGAIWTFHLASAVSTPLIWPTLLALCALTAAIMIPRSLFGVGTLGRRLYQAPDSHGGAWISGSVLALTAISVFIYLTTPITIVLTQVAFFSACLSALSAGALATTVTSNPLRSRDTWKIGSLCCFICFLWQFCNTRSAYHLPLLLLAPLTGIIIFMEGSQAGGDGHSHSHSHHHSYEHVKCSLVSKFLLHHTTPGTVVHSILLETDSRRIAYFGWYENRPDTYDG